MCYALYAISFKDKIKLIKTAWNYVYYFLIKSFFGSVFNQTLVNWFNGFTLLWWCLLYTDKSSGPTHLNEIQL